MRSIRGRNGHANINSVKVVLQNNWAIIFGLEKTALGVNILITSAIQFEI